MFVIVALIFFTFVLIYAWTHNRYKFWIQRGFISVPTSFPFGNLKGMGTKIPTCEGLDSFYKAYKGKAKALGIYFFVSPTLMIMDIELLKNVFIRDFTSFHDRGFYYNKEDDPMSANLLTLEGQEWRERRVKLSPIFTSGKMKMMFEAVDAIGDKFIKAVDKELKITSRLEMRQMFAKFSTDVISSVAFGLDSNCLEDPSSEFYKQGKRLFDLSSIEFLKFFFTSAFPTLSRRLHLRANAKEPSDFLQKVFIETIKKREESGVPRNDFVQLLLKLRETVSLSLNEMAAEGFIFFSGGFETSSSTLTFCIYELSLNPEVQQRLRLEIQDGLNKNEGAISYDLLFHFEYLDMVVKETLRKYPIIPGMLRKCTKEYQIPETNLVIPEGQNVVIPIYSIQHDPEFYPEPSKFDPERFSAENSEGRDPMTFLAFGEGPRGCIGARFGMLQVKLALVKLLTNYEFKVCERTPIPMKFIAAAPFLAPAGGMWLEVKSLEL